MITERKRQILNKKLERFNALNKATGYLIISDMDDMVQGILNDTEYEVMKQRLDHWQDKAVDMIATLNE